MPWNWERVQLEEMAVVGALDYLSDKKRKKKKKRSYQEGQEVGLCLRQEILGE